LFHRRPTAISCWRTPAHRLYGRNGPRVLFRNCL